MPMPPQSISSNEHFSGPRDKPRKWTGTKSRKGSIRGHSRLLEKRPNWQVTKRSLFGLAFSDLTSKIGHCSLFGLMKSRFSYPSFLIVTSIRPRTLIVLIPSISPDLERPLLEVARFFGLESDLYQIPRNWAHPLGHSYIVNFVDNDLFSSFNYDPCESQ